MPILSNVDVPTVIKALLDLAREAERGERLCRQNRQYARAQRFDGEAVAYYYAARLLGWRQFGEGDVPARKIG